jgi:phosphoribosylanthranilate isomerase
MSKIKICGLSRVEDIKIVNRVLPDFIGFVFASSRRRVDIATAAALKKELDPRIEAVGVFVNEGIDTIARMYKRKIIDVVQLHGDEDEAYIAKLKKHCDCPLIKAVGVGSVLPPLPRRADFLLFDTLAEQRGGTGRTFDWDILKKYAGLPYFLSGGLDVNNATKAIKTLSPYCVDVSSGVESDGIKNEKKIDAFVRLVRGNTK